MKIIIFFLLFAFMAGGSFAQSQLPDSTHLLNQVGDIIFNPQTDQYDFKLCDKDNIYQYYGVNTSYKGEARALKNELLGKLPYMPQFKLITGSVTIRFIVNCKGQTGWFRIYQLNRDYQKTVFSPVFVQMVLGAVKSLKGWIPGKLPGGAACDTYYYLHFKIVNGRIKEIAI